MPLPFAYRACAGHTFRTYGLLVVHAVRRDEGRTSLNMAVRPIRGRVLRRLRFVLLGQNFGEVLLNVFEKDGHAAASRWEEALGMDCSLEEPFEALLADHVRAATESEDTRGRMLFHADGTGPFGPGSRDNISVVIRPPGSGVAF